MVEHTPGFEPVPTQQGPPETPPSKKPSVYIFDSNGDTRIILRTCLTQNIVWEADKIWVEQERPTNAPHIDWSQVTFSSFSNGEHIRPASPDDEIDPDYTDAGANPDSKSSPTQNLNYGETCVIPLERIEIQMLVSGKHLELASPVFKTMVTGPFAEGKADSSGTRQITASDWDPEAFRIIMNIIHGYHRGVPRSLSLEMLTKVAMIVDYYECHESVEVYIDIWLKRLITEIPTLYGRESILCMFISWVFSKRTAFGKMAELALRHSQKLIEADDVPIPAHILDEINIARQNNLAETFSAVYELLDRLQEEEECSFECSSMLLGVLTKELKTRGILYPRIAPPFDGFSIEGCKEMITGFRKPRWYKVHNSNHHCYIQDKLSMSLAKVEEDLRVFDLQDFQNIKNHGGV